MKQARQIIQCQESGLPLLKDPKWHNIHKNNYHYSYTKVGEAIVHVHNRGNVKHFDSTVHAGLIKEFVRDTGVNIPYVEIRDFKYIDGRGSYKQIQATKEYILANQKNLAGFMYCNMPFWVRSITRAGFKAYTVSTKFAACKTYDQAIEKAMEVLGNRQGGFKSTPILSYDQIRFTTGWQYENPDRGLVYKNGVITDRLFFSSIQADSVADEDMDPLLFAMEQVFKDGAITESGYIRIADYSGLKRMSLRARRRYGQALNHLAKTYDARPGATYVCGANLVIRSSIKLFSGFINQKIRFTDSVPAAFKEINKLESLQTTGNKNIIVTAQNIEEINELCGIMLWPEEEIQDKSIGKLSRDNPLMELSETLKVVHTDLADLRRRKAEQIRKVELARKEAEAANRAKSDFLANMSHEIRTPMNGVIGMLDILKETSLDKIQKEFLETAGQSAEALLGIVNDILDFSKIESGKMTIETISFNLRELLDSVNDVIAVEAFGKGLEFGSLMTSEVPDYIESDPGRLRQVLTNLIQNAVKFVTHGEVFVRVSLDSIETSQLTLLFEITDTGIGIPKEKRDGLFDAFTQVDTSTTRIYGGTGLGLAITRQLVEIMGGNIGVESEPNQGSRFWFTLPVKGQSQPNNLPGPGFKDIPPVLILSPDSLTRRILTAYLTEWNCPHEIIEDIQSKLAAIDTKGKRRLILADSRRTDLAEQIALASEAPEISFITKIPQQISHPSPPGRRLKIMMGSRHASESCPGISRYMSWLKIFHLYLHLVPWSQVPAD